MFLDDRVDRSRSESRSRSNLRVSTNRDSIRCYRYREYDHFAIETIYHRDNSRERFERSRDRNRDSLTKSKNVFG